MHDTLATMYILFILVNFGLAVYFWRQSYLRQKEVTDIDRAEAARYFKGSIDDGSIPEQEHVEYTAGMSATLQGNVVTFTKQRKIVLKEWQI